MAKYDLIIYGENNEEIKTYKTDIIKMSTVIKAAEIADSMEKDTNMPITEQYKKFATVAALVFPGLSAEEALEADSNDLKNLFKQVLALNEGINKGSKNA